MEHAVERSPQPVMPLPWQLGMLGYLGGLLAWTYPLAAGLASVLLLCALARGRTIALVGLCFALGLMVAAPADRDAEDARTGQLRLRGVVDEVRTHPDRRISILARDVIDVDANATLPGRVLWSWENPPLVPHPGQEFEGRLKVRESRGRANFGLSGSEEHWSRHGVRHRIYSNGQAEVRWGPGRPPLRDRLLARVDSLLPEGQPGAVIRALVFGDRFLLDAVFMDRVRRASLSHSLALSGLHLGLVAGFGFAAAWGVGWAWPGLLLRLPRQKLGLLLALPLALGYLWLGGFTPSLLRATIMLGAAAAHLFRGSRSLPQDALLTAVCVLVLLDPASVHDLSLQLSVLAVAGIVLFMPLVADLLTPLRGRGRVGRVAHAVLTLAAVTVSANLFLLPVLVLYFSELAGHLWLNLLWLPALSLFVLPLSFLGLLCSPVLPTLAEPVFILAGLGVRGLELGLQALDSRGWLEALVVLRPAGFQVVGYWTALLSGCVMLGARRHAPARALAFLGLGLALMVAPAVWQEAGRWREEVELTVLDTGMSQALTVRGPRGRTVLVDGAGGWGAGYDPGRALVGPALAWNRPPRVEGVILTHVDADHVRGLFYILGAFDVGWFGWSGLVDRTDDSRRLSDILARADWPVRQLRAGDRVEVEPDLWLEVLHPPPGFQGISENETSVVLRLVWHGRGLALLPGDAERRALGRLAARPEDLTAEVLVLPHHGSASSLSPRFYTRVGAAWAVAACGPGNRFGLPHADVVRAVEDSGARVLTTAEHGAARFIWRPGHPLRVRTARNKEIPRP